MSEHGFSLVLFHSFILIWLVGFEAPMYWVGGNDLATKGRWVWASNGYRIYPYVNWKAEATEADSDGRCVGLDAITFQWMVRPCEDQASFFCEKGKCKDNVELLG